MLTAQITDNTTWDMDRRLQAMEEGTIREYNRCRQLTTSHFVLVLYHIVHRREASREGFILRIDISTSAEASAFGFFPSSRPQLPRTEQVAGG